MSTASNFVALSFPLMISCDALRLSDEIEFCEVGSLGTLTLRTTLGKKKIGLGAGRRPYLQDLRFDSTKLSPEGD